MDISRSRAMKRLGLYFVLILLFSPSSEASLSRWFALGPAPAEPDPPLRSRPTDFDIETGQILSSRGKDLVEEARHDSCWHSAYSRLLSSCREILKDEEKKARLALWLMNCFLRVSERDAIYCPESVPISQCTSGLSDHTNAIFLAFFIDVASICHHLQYVISSLCHILQFCALVFKLRMHQFASISLSSNSFSVDSGLPQLLMVVFLLLCCILAPGGQ